MFNQDRQPNFDGIHSLAGFTSLTFGQFGPALGGRRGGVKTFILLSAGNTAVTLGFVAGTFLVAGELVSLIERLYLRGSVP